MSKATEDEVIASFRQYLCDYGELCGRAVAAENEGQYSDLLWGQARSRFDKLMTSFALVVSRAVEAGL